MGAERLADESLSLCVPPAESKATYCKPGRRDPAVAVVDADHAHEPRLVAVAGVGRAQCFKREMARTRTDVLSA
jgi:hypothetical protein